MTTINFVSHGHLTIGAEIELQLINEKTFDLFPVAQDIINQFGDTRFVKPEIFQSMLEINSAICQNVHELGNDLKITINSLYPVCRQHNSYLATTGTHPFALWSDRILSPESRYGELIDRNQWVARRLSIFALHVHLGMESKEECIHFMNFFQYFLPHLIALSASSPFWQGHNTGLFSSRLTVYEASPSSGHCQWQHSWEHFEEQYYSLLRCQAIHSTKDLWWDLRPSPHYGTLEIRVCDGIATLPELLGLLAFIHSLAHWFKELSPKERTTSSFHNPLPLWLIRENKWRAIRYGLDMELITSPSGTTLPLRQALYGALDFLSPIIKRFGYEEYQAYLEKIMNDGNSAKRQLQLFTQCPNLLEVTRMNVLDFEQSYIATSSD